MDQLQKLMAELTAAKKAGLAILDKAASDGGRDLTESEDATLIEHEATVDQLEGEIAATQKVAARRARMAAVTTTALGGAVALAGAVAPVGAAPAGGSPNLLPYGVAARVMQLDPALSHDFKSMAEFAVTVRRAGQPGADKDMRLIASDGTPLVAGNIHAAPANFHTGGGDGGEGFLMPPAFSQTIFEVMEDADEFGAFTDEEMTNAREVKGVADEATPWGATGVQANWVGEGQQMIASKLALNPRTTVLHKIYAYILATGDLLEDAPLLQGRITKRAGQALSWKRQDSFMWGTGVGQPKGWMNAAALITVAKESGQSADTVLVANLAKMFARLTVVPGDRAMWLINRNVLPQLVGLTVGDVPVWTPPASGVTGAPGGQLFGFPILFSEHTETLGDKGDIQLVSLKGYYSLKRESAPDFASSIHLFFDYDIEAFRLMTRFGGEPHLSAAIAAPTRGGGAANSKSHFITLAERASRSGLGVTAKSKEQGPPGGGPDNNRESK